MMHCGLEPAAVDAVLLTHEHGDHVRGLDVFCRRHASGVVVYSSSGTRRAAGLDGFVACVESISCGQQLRIGDIEVTPFTTSHDAAEPLGFRFTSGGSTLGLITDSGVFTPQAAEALTSCDVIAMESNHDVEMLANGPYPAYLKRRIRSAHGHLSNVQAADALERVAHDGLRSVIALHRSRTNNTAKLAEAGLSVRIAQLGLAARVGVASQDVPYDSVPAQGTLFAV